MKGLIIKVCLLGLFLASNSFAQPVPTGSDAATWSTWLVDTDAIAASVEVPSESAREAEVQEVITLAEQRDEAILQKVAYWNTASPSYRWLEVLIEPYSKGPPSPAVSRAIALMNVAIYDAVVTTWKAKYASAKENMASTVSPSTLSEDLDVLVPTGHHPSFPSEHAAVAAAASEVLAYLQPELADDFRAKAQEAMESRLFAGANLRSDIDAGQRIGAAVAEEIIAWAMQDGADTPWDITIPEDSLFAVEEPVFPMTGSWKTWAIDSGSQFRAPEPPAYDSDRVLADLEEIKAVEATLPNVQQATYWATLYTGWQIWYDFANKLLFEQRQADNVPYMALIYSGFGVASYDAIVGCFDSKYTYLYARPSHIDDDVQPLIPVPPHPSYPSAHSCISNAAAHVSAYFFPHAADEALGMAQAAGQSRILGGIHYQIDNQAGLELGEKVAQVVIAKLKTLVH